MPLSSTTLGTQLAGLVPVMSEVEAINNLATAFETYFYESSVLGIPATPGALAGATLAMKGALVGLSVPGAAAMSFQLGIIAFWGAVASSAPTIWVTAPPIVSAVPPTGLGGISAALTPVFAANVAGGLSLIDSANAVAAVLHPLQLGGIATLTPPPPATAPIL